MDFKTLQYFYTVAREQNITHAARKLHISQPPLSAQIRQLEEDLGVQLFIRGRRRLQLTDAGMVLFKRSEQILKLVQDTREELRSLDKEMTGKIRIGQVEGRAPYLTARWIAGFREEFPLVEFSLWNGSSDEVAEQLHRGLIDIAVIAAPYDAEQLEGISVGREPWVAILPAGHPLTQESGCELPLRKLEGEPLIIPDRPSRIEAVRRWFSDIGVQPQILCTLSSYVDAVALAEQGAGISIFPQGTYTPNPHIATRVITEPAKYIEYFCTWERSAPPRGLVQAFLEFVEDFMEEDRIHGDRYRVKEPVFEIPEGAEML